MSELRAIEGASVSIERVRELSESAPSVLVFPARSEKAEELTEINPSALESMSGMNIAE